MRGYPKGGCLRQPAHHDTKLHHSPIGGLHPAAGGSAILVTPHGSAVRNEHPDNSHLKARHQPPSPPSRCRRQRPYTAQHGSAVPQTMRNNTALVDDGNISQHIDTRQGF